MCVCLYVAGVVFQSSSHIPIAGGLKGGKVFRLNLRSAEVMELLSASVSSSMNSDHSVGLADMRIEGVHMCQGLRSVCGPWHVLRDVN